MMSSRISKATTTVTKMIKNNNGFFFVSVLIFFFATSNIPAQSIDTLTAIHCPAEWHQIIAKNTFDETLLVESLTFCTNRIRASRKLPLLQSSAPLQISSKKHSCEMARLSHLSHQSPTLSSRTLNQRIANEGIVLENTAIAENIAVDFVLAISDLPYHIRKNSKGSQYIDAKTGKPIKAQSYFDFAQRLVHLWMASPGHRDNIINPVFTNVGFGVCYGNYKGLEAIYVTQNFLGNFSSEYRQNL